MCVLLSAENDRGNEMRKDQQLGLDELMIVNPSSSGTEAIFLGKDGALYQVQGLGEEQAQQGIGRYFLGEDGSLYQVESLKDSGTAETAQGSGENPGQEEVRAFGRYFLGDDGVLYEVVR
jgi:hypothetical protein